MSIPLQVVDIGLRAVNLSGERKSSFISYNDATEVYRIRDKEELLIRFKTEAELEVFLQRMIDEEVPFLDSYYQDGYSAYFFARELVDEGKLKGHIVRSVWKDGEYRIEDADD